MISSTFSFARAKTQNKREKKSTCLSHEVKHSHTHTYKHTHKEDERINQNHQSAAATLSPTCASVQEVTLVNSRQLISTNQAKGKLSEKDGVANFLASAK